MPFKENTSLLRDGDSPTVGQVSREGPLYQVNTARRSESLTGQLGQTLLLEATTYPGSSKAGSSKRELIIL